MSGDFLSCEVHLSPERRVQTDSVPGLANPVNIKLLGDYLKSQVIDIVLLDDLYVVGIIMRLFYVLDFSPHNQKFLRSR